MKIKITQNRPQKSKDGIIKIAEIFYLYKKNNLILKNETELRVASGETIRRFLNAYPSWVFFCV